MKNKILHVFVWASLFMIENLGYVAAWNKEFWIFSSFNLLLAMLLFYLYRHYGVKLYKEVAINPIEQFSQFKAFWCLGGLLVVYIGVKIFVDLYVFNVGNNISVLAYSAILLRIALSFALPGLFFGISENRKVIIETLNARQNQLEEKNRQLSIRHNELENEITFANVRLIMVQEQLEATYREYTQKFKEYEEWIRRMRNDDDGDEWKRNLE